MSLKNNLIVLVFLIQFFSIQLIAQDTGNSPYSIIGIGDLNYPGNIRNVGMGNTGVAAPHAEFINIINPALLPVNYTMNRDSTVKYTMLETGFMGDFRNIKNNKASQNTGGFNIQYISLAFPLSQHWTTSVGLRPYSSVKHEYTSVARINDTIPYLSEDFYKGGLNQVHLANGFDISKNFSIGLTAAYLFGTINEEKIVQSYVNNQYTVKTGLQNKNTFKGFELKPGISYRMQIKDSAGVSKGTYLNFGFTYDYFVNMKTKSVKNLILKDEKDQIFIFDSTKTIVHQLNAKFPATYNFGISLQKEDRWMITSEVTISQWADFKTLHLLPPNVTMKNSYSISLGGEFKPAKSITLTSKEYRAGFTYSKLPFSFYGYQVEDISMSLGTTIPLGRKDTRYKSKPLTKLNAGLVLGTRGTIERGLVKEQYFRIFVGALIQDKWFQRWKID